MTTFLNDLETIPATATITTGNSGGGADSPFSVVNIGAGGTLIADTTRAMHGLQAMAIMGASGQICYVAYQFTANASAAAHIYVYFTSLPSVAQALLQFRSTSAQAVTVTINSSGKLGINDAGGAPGEWTAAAAISPNTWYRIELSATVATATTGTINCSYYLGDSGSAIENHTNVGGANVGTGNLTEIRYGKVASSTYAGTFWMDEPQVNTGTTTFVGPTASTVPNPPTGASATAGSFQAVVTWAVPGYNGGSAVTGYTVTASPGGATATASGPTATTATVTGLTAGVSYTFTVHATNTNGNSAESVASSAVVVVGAGQAIAPLSDITVSGWVSSDSATPLASDLSESSPDDSQYVTSPSNPSGVTFEVKFATVSTPSDNLGWAIQARARFRSAASGSFTLNLVQGTTIIASTNVTLTSSFATYTLTVTPTQGASITNLSDLRARFSNVTAS